MKKLSIKKIIEFKAKSKRGKKNFASDLKIDKEKVKTDGGGDYWISCLSSISSSFQTNETQNIEDKIEELGGKHGEAEDKRIKDMYKRNIDILHNYKSFDFKKWKPSKKVAFLKKHKDDLTLTIKGLQVQIAPNHVFIFSKSDEKEIGAIWFIAKLKGFKKDELGMFTDILYRYLKTHYSKDYIINPKYCIAVDVFNNFEVNYSQLEKGEVSAILNPTLDEIKKLM